MDGDSFVDERSILNDSAIVLGTSVGDIVDTDDSAINCLADVIESNLIQRSDIDSIKTSKKKIHRPCPFCKDARLHSALTRHLKLVHKDRPDVIKAMSLQKKEQIQAFAALRKNAIFHHNKKEMEKENPNYIRERVRESDTDVLMVCALCKGFYSKKYKARHQIHCGRDSGQVMIPLVPVDSLVRIDELDDAFKAVINKMILDDVSTMAKTDPVILMVGIRIYNGHKCKTEKKYEVEKRVRQTMRQLGRLYIIFKNEMPSTPDASDMFKKENLKHLRTAIEELSQGEDKIKCGLKIQLQNTIKLAAKMLQGHLLVYGKEGDADKVRDFTTVFSLLEEEIFGGALYTIRQKRNKSTRKPASLPNEEVIRLLTDYINKTTDKSYILFKHPSSIFVDVRDAACARLTIYNGRRGGEPARLFLYQWEEAVEGTWLREETRQAYKDEISTGNRITFQEGKGYKQVPVFFPPDIISAMMFLSSEEVRRDSNILPKNQYLFPSTNGSDNHVSGWHSMVSCCKKANLDSNVNGTMNRHRVSTLIGALGLPESEQQLAFDHFGHSGDINRNVYQVPQAERQLQSTGRYLKLIDKGNASSSTTPVISKTAEKSKNYT